ncbi:hypothetical protein AAFF_G00213580 [Aldrovandia affinis]|uniref:Uncharacterized protein n=1 Tax=Aldrovandia affinis TaxID=143900 RepID=A0AAD7W599_9TELE|nr:hypothetical protein AAFF_G00213580 [Aldrovandia affinis]
MDAVATETVNKARHSWISDQQKIFSGRVCRRHQTRVYHSRHPPVGSGPPLDRSRLNTGQSQRSECLPRTRNGEEDLQKTSAKQSNNPAVYNQG